MSIQRKLKKIKWISDIKNLSIHIVDKPILIKMYFFIDSQEFNDDDFKNQCSSLKNVIKLINKSLITPMDSNFTNTQEF